MDNKAVTDYQPKYYVKFNNSTGKILALGMSPLPEEDNEDIIVIETWNTMVDEILKGKRSRRSVGPVFDPETRQWDIGVKSNVLVLQEQSSRLLQVTNKRNTNVDIGIHIYKKDLQLEITANYHIIKKNMNLADIADISKSADAGLLNLYFTKKGDPDYLIDSLQVDPLVLLSNKTLRYSLPNDITKHADLDEISIFTRPIFHSYGLQISDQVIKSDYYLNKRHVLQTAGRAESCHVALIQQGNDIKIQSFLSEIDSTAPQRKEVKFVVCDNNIDIPVGQFILDNADIYSGKSFVLKTKFKWPKRPIIIYKSEGLVVNYLGDTYGGTNQR